MSSFVLLGLWWGMAGFHRQITSTRPKLNGQMRYARLFQRFAYVTVLSAREKTTRCTESRPIARVFRGGQLLTYRFLLWPSQSHGFILPTE